jgi:hypothetical protein
VEYLRQLVTARAKENYSQLVESAGAPARAPGRGRPARPAARRAAGATRPRAGARRTRLLFFITPPSAFNIPLSLAGGGGADFAATLTELLRDVALALDENEPFLREAFGPGAVLAAAGGLQRVCDEEGGRVLQRFIQLRRLPQLVKEVGSLSSARRAADGAAAAAPQPVDPRQARAAAAHAPAPRRRPPGAPARESARAATWRGRAAAWRGT